MKHILAIAAAVLLSASGASAAGRSRKRSRRRRSRRRQRHAISQEAPANGTARGKELWKRPCSTRWRRRS